MLQRTAFAKGSASGSWAPRPGRLTPATPTTGLPPVEEAEDFLVEEPPFFQSPGSPGGQQISPTLRAFEEQMRQTTNEMLAHMMGWPSGQYSTPDFAQVPVPTQPQGPGGIAYPPPGYGVIMTPGLEPMIYDPFGPTPYQSSAGMSDAQKEALLHQRESDFMMQSRMGGVGGYGGYGGYSGGYTGNDGGYPYCRQQQDGFYYR